MKKILITGGAGYIGNVLTDVLLNNQEKYHVTVLDNLIHKNRSIIEQCGKPNFEFVYGDVRNSEVYKKLISKNDVIINLAAYVGVPICNKFPNEAKQINRESVEFLSRHITKDQYVIYTTTNSGYGIGLHKEGKAVFCTEETPLSPISLYGETKCDGEKYLMDTGNATSLRLATVFGTSRKMRLDLLVNDFVWRAWNDKFIVLFESHFMRNSVHIKDVANAILFCIENNNMKGEIYNIGNTQININKMQLCLQIKKHLPDFFITESQFNKDPDKRNYIVSNEKIESLGWSCNHSLDDGIKELIRSCPIIKNSIINEL